MLLCGGSGISRCPLLHFHRSRKTLSCVFEREGALISPLHRSHRETTPPNKEINRRKSVCVGGGDNDARGTQQWILSSPTPLVTAQQPHTFVTSWFRATCKCINLSSATSLPLQILHRPFCSLENILLNLGGLEMEFLMLFLSARPRKRHLIICSNAEVHNHSRRRDEITLFVYLCVFLLKRAIGGPLPHHAFRSHKSIPC